MSQNKEDKTPESDYAPYPKLDPDDINPNPDEKWTTVSMGSHPQPENSAQDAPSGPAHSADRGAGLETGAPSSVPGGVGGGGGGGATTMPAESNPYVSSSPAGSNPYVSSSEAGSNPYVSPSPASSSSVKEKMDSVRGALGKWGKKAAETTKKYQDTAGNMWQHLKTGPSIADAAVGRIAQGTKVLAEGGYEKIFRQSFETLPEEQLLKSYACYLSTSAGPVMGILYLSTAKLAFASDSPLSYTAGDQTQWSYYKVVIPLHQLKTINPSTSKVNQAEKYIQIISIDSHEFWFMGFVHYDGAVKNLLGAVTPIHNL